MMISKEKYKDILNQAAASGMKKLEASKIMRSRKTKYTSHGFAAAVTAACILVLCAGTAIAGVITGFWGNGLDSIINGSDEQRKELTSKGLYINLPDAESVTVKGITITPQAAITDGSVGYISLKVEGYKLDEASGRPTFQSKGDYYVAGVYEDHDYRRDMQIEGFHWFSGGDNHYGFYDGISSYSDGKYYYSDGLEALVDNYGQPKGRYIAEDGSLEYIAEVLYNEGNDTLFGKTVHFEMDDLSTASYSKAKSDPDYYTNVVKGKWVLDVTFPDEKEIRLITKTVQTEAEIGEACCNVKEVTLSPLSVILKYSIYQEGGCLEVSGIVYDGGKTLEILDPYYQTATAPGMECITINALDNIIDIEGVRAIEVTYNNFTYDITAKEQLNLK